MSGLSGMTGFARVEGAHGDWSWAVEARSVNGRNLEVRFRGPPSFEGLDRIARDLAQSRLQRGQISLNLQAKRAEGAQPPPRINTAALDHYVALGQDLVARGAAPPAADGLLALRGVLEAAEETEDPDARGALEAAMTASLAEALDALKVSRGQEGAQLAPVLSGLVDDIERLVAAAGSEAAAQTEAIRDRFTRRMNELAPDTPDLEARIVQEAAALAVRADVREELDRLGAHIGAARALINGAGPAGRKLDFLMQEFMREANTLCSKSAVAALTAVGLDLKATIEQLREQVQNVE